MRKAHSFGCLPRSLSDCILLAKLEETRFASATLHSWDSTRYPKKNAGIPRAACSDACKMGVSPCKKKVYACLPFHNFGLSARRCPQRNYCQSQPTARTIVNLMVKEGLIIKCVSGGCIPPAVFETTMHQPLSDAGDEGTFKDRIEGKGLTAPLCLIYPLSHVSCR